ncbi:MAG: response regulator, partial [Proteobacteria bacterium]|nr:response regulator [Pseudomonadota bacterium]
LGEDDEKDTSILDVFANVGSGFCLQRLKETLKSANARIRNYGKSKLTALGKAAVPVMIPNLFSNDSDLQIHSLNILQEIGDESAVMSVRQLLDNQPEDANVRFAAYETLANLPTRKIEYVLAAGLTDPDDGIRLAAARAVENSFNTVLLAGINNMIKKRDAEAIRIIKAVIDAQTDRLFIRLLDNDFFRNLMFDYVAIRIHPDIRRYYIELLKKNDLAQLANDIVSHSKTVELHEARPKICAVDDSRMILHIYRSILNDLGYDPVLFQYPRDFLNWLTEEKPKAVFTDLNMPEITGLELVDKVRARYDKNEVPVVMATTQKDKQDRTEAERKGVNVFLFKPFDINTIENVLNNLWS